MKVLCVSDGQIEISRGPIFRFIGLLPELAQRCDLHVLVLGDSCAELEMALIEAAVTVYRTPIHIEGWTVRNADKIADVVCALSEAEKFDLVVLQWEIWDLIASICRSLGPLVTPFAVVFHAVPFLNTPYPPLSDFETDVAKRVGTETDLSIRDFIAAKSGGIREVLRRVHAIAPNVTTRWYLKHYFPEMRVTVAEPGYALDFEMIDSTLGVGRDHTFAFMSKLVSEKGIFELLEIFAKIRRHVSTTKLLIVGSFLDSSTRETFKSLLNSTGLASEVEMAGWLSGVDKYRALRRASVFLYPARGSDTFCISLLEALAVGLPAVAYDLPFVRDVYPKDVVLRCPLGDIDQFAELAIALVKRSNSLRGSATSFSRKYESWENVAAAELRAYRSITSKA